MAAGRLALCYHRFSRRNLLTTSLTESIRITGIVCSVHSKPFSKESRRQKFSKSAAILAFTSFGLYFLYNLKCWKKVYALEKTQEAEAGEFREDLETYSLEEIGKHDSKRNGVWVTYRRGVYDITDFIDKHPGGPGKIMMAAGASIEPFWAIFANHNNKDIHSLLESMRIGNISSKDVEITNVDEHDPYAFEPKRHKILKVNGKKPFCAEPPPSVLIESFHTPKEFFYVRNHLPVPQIDLENYTLALSVEDENLKEFSLKEIKNLPKYTITTAIMCGGNRRSEMAEAKPLRGLSWGIGAVGNAKWSGARLCDILQKLGINEEEYNHVQFEGLDLDPSGVPYGASIPIHKAMDPRSDVILAYEMNGEPIPLDHGFPIRAIVPGVVGARNVKWLSRIVLSKEESPSQFQRGDYKGFSPSVDWDTVDFSKSPAIQEMPVVSAICSPEPNEKISLKSGTVPVKGYAWSGGGRKIIRVDVTADQGETWHTATLYAEDSDAKEGRYWSWSLWKVDIPTKDLGSNSEIEIWAKAVDSSYNVQPESFKNIWNLRGFLCNAYHRVKVQMVE